MTLSIFKRLILSAFVAVFAASCSTTDAGRNQLTLHSEKQLELEAKKNFEIMRANLPLVQERGTIDFVACVANALIESMDEDDASMNWELAIFDQPVVNATVAPGGKISVYKGLIDLTENQDQMASVMGHEMGHATAKHTNERMTRGTLTDAGIEVAAILLGGGYYQQTQGAYQAMKTAEDLGLNRPFSRKMEAEADEIGLIYMARAGFDPRQSVEFWQIMAGQEKQHQIAEMLSTHPSDASRMEASIQQLPEALAVYNQAVAEGQQPDCIR